MAWTQRVGIALSLLVCVPTIAAGQVTVTTLKPSHDTFLAEKGGKKPKGNGKVLLVGERDTALLKFDLSPIPESVFIREAKLRLFLIKYKRGQGMTTVSAHEVTDPWEEDTATSKNQPWVEPIPEGESSIDWSKHRDFVEWEIGDLVQSWVSSPATNHGVALIGSGKAAKFGAQEGVLSTPELLVVYETFTEGGGVPGPSGPVGPMGP